MPGEDRRGPLGEGPRTGRSLGRCRSNGTEVTESQNPQPTQRDEEVGSGLAPDQTRGRGRGLGRGMGRGDGRGLGRRRGPGRRGGHGRGWARG